MADREWKPRANPWLIAAAVILPTFMEVIDTSIATVAVPYIAGSLSASTDEATYVLTFYLLSNAVFLPASNWFSLRFGRKRYLMASIVVFTMASFACGAANSLVFILIARLIQGAAGGALQPISQAIIQESFPPEKRGMGMAIFALGVVVAPVAGPTLGGWLTDTYSWRWAFYINVPIGILALFIIARLIEDPPYVKDAHPGRLDKVGLGLLAVGLGCMQIILDRGQQADWFGAQWVRYTFTIMVACLVAFIIQQLKNKHPLVNLAVFKNRNFAMGCLLVFIFGVSIYGVVTLLPLYYQTVMGYSALEAGIVVAPRGIGAIVITPIVGFLTAKIDNRYLIAMGFAVFAFCSYLLGRIYLGIAPSTMLWPIIVTGLGLGMIFVPLATTTMGDLPQAAVGNGTGIFNLLRNIGGSVGISIVETILLRHEQLHRSELSHRLSPGLRTFQSQFGGMAQSLSEKFNDVTAQKKALGLLQSALDRQAALWSYVDDFRYLAIACAVCVPIAFALKKTAGKGRVAVH